MTFERITVTGTEDILMAAVLAKGETMIENAAREPEVVDLAALLVKMGAKIEGAGTSTIRVQGVEKLHGATHEIIADRIEAGTFVVAGAITGGDLTVTGCVPEHLGALIDKLREAGVKVTTDRGHYHSGEAQRATAPVDMTTQEYPGFATDLQAQYMALMTQAEGISIITETFSKIVSCTRRNWCEWERKSGSTGKAIVAGGSRMTGAGVIASDLRASASLVLAALVASGETVIDRVYHIDRGYEKIEAKLSRCGRANRVETDGISGMDAQSRDFSIWLTTRGSRIRETDVEGYKEMLARGEPHVLVDVREDHEFSAGHVKGAVHLSKGIIERDMETKYPDKETTLVLYCGGGFRSALAADALGRMGYTNAISLDGGWRALKESGLPIE